MVRQLVLIRWAADAPADAAELVTRAMLRLGESMPQVRDMRMGVDVGVRPDNFDFAVSVDFDTVADYLAYREDPRHWQVVEEVISPVMAARAGVVFEWAHS